MSKTNHTPAEQRGIVKNPNNEAYREDRNNRIQQGHPDIPPPPRRPAPEKK
jgi:hypothetical protein